MRSGGARSEAQLGRVRVHPGVRGASTHGSSPGNSGSIRWGVTQRGGDFREARPLVGDWARIIRVVRMGLSREEQEEGRMRIQNRIRVALAIAAAISMFVGAAFAEEPQDQAAAASSSHLQDLQVSEDAYNDYLTSSPDVTCDTRARGGNGYPKVDNPNVGAVYARDVADWSVECVSLAENPPQYYLTMQVVFQYYDSGWQDISETQIQCQVPSLRGLAALPHCANEYVYPYDHRSNNKWHRTKFKLVGPVDLEPLYSAKHWFAFSKADE